MALTGGRIAASIYGKNGNDFKFSGAIMGRTNNFPNVGVIMYEAPAGTTAAGVAIATILEVQPTGLNVNPDKYMSSQTITAILAAST